MVENSKLTRSVWVGFLQLDEYDESISVHERVSWRVSALFEGFLDGVLPDGSSVDFELDRYADVMGKSLAALAGTVTQIRWLDYPVSKLRNASSVPAESSPTARSIYSTKEPMGRRRQDRDIRLVQREIATPGFGGFVVDIVLNSNSEELESLRSRLPDLPGAP